MIPVRRMQVDNARSGPHKHPCGSADLSLPTAWSLRMAVDDLLRAAHATARGGPRTRYLEPSRVEVVAARRNASLP